MFGQHNTIHYLYFMIQTKTNKTMKLHLSKFKGGHNSMTCSNAFTKGRILSFEEFELAEAQGRPTCQKCANSYTYKKYLNQTNRR